MSQLPFYFPHKILNSFHSALILTPLSFTETKRCASKWEDWTYGWGKMEIPPPNISFASKWIWKAWVKMSKRQTVLEGSPQSWLAISTTPRQDWLLSLAFAHPSYREGQSKQCDTVKKGLRKLKGLMTAELWSGRCSSSSRSLPLQTNNVDANRLLTVYQNGQRDLLCETSTFPP